MIKGIMHSADFEENTITIEVQGEFRVMAVGYVLLTDREWEKLSKLHQPTVSSRRELLLAFLKSISVSHPKTNEIVVDDFLSKYESK